MIIPSQIRAARGLVGLSQRALGQAAGLSLPTVKRFETGNGAKVSADAVEKIQRALESAGVIFVAENDDGPGVRLRKGVKVASAAPNAEPEPRADKRRAVRGHAENAVERALAGLPHTEHEKASRKRKLTRMPKDLKPK